jgi:hypothetical protein
MIYGDEVGLSFPDRIIIVSCNPNVSGMGGSCLFSTCPTKSMVEISLYEKVQLVDDRLMEGKFLDFLLPVAADEEDRWHLTRWYPFLAKNAQIRESRLHSTLSALITFIFLSR